MVDVDRERRDKKWVCPNDRGLALLAKVGAGWSVKTQQYQSYRKQSVPLDETEQQVILNVIQRAEALENLEQERVGRLVDRLDNMKRNVIRSGTNQCILCGAHCILFGMLSTNSILCHDCRKTVCQKCGVETFSGPGPRKEVIWRCKICAETREMWKKTGAWFFKAVPKHVLPVKKPPIESKFCYGSRIGLEKSTWSRALNMRSSEAEEESSSDDDRASRLLASRSRRAEEPATSTYSQSSLWQVPTVDKRNSGTRYNEFTSEVKESITDDKPVPVRPRRGMPLSFRRDTSESSESSGSVTMATFSLTHNSESVTSRGKSFNGDTDDVNYSSSVLSHSRQNSQLSLLTNRDWCSESDHFSLSGSSINGHKIGVSFSEEISEDFSSSVPNGNLGVVELSLVYNSVSSSIHVSLHRAKNLKAMDINGLADPFCKLNLLPAANKSHRLRTRTVHKTCNPEFNETLTFYGVTENDMAVRSLHILVLDDDKYGHDFMGEAKYSLDKLRPDVDRDLNLFLEKNYPVENEEVWGEEGWNHGQILITLCYSTRRKALIVGIVRCTNLLPMDSNGFSDPFVKLYLHPDHYHRKYKTGVKWKNLNPIFNEEYAFEAKITDLSQQTLVLTVWDKDYGKSNDYLGCLELGCKSKGERLRQWVDMIKFPDHKHEGWHNLCEDPPPT